MTRDEEAPANHPAYTFQHPSADSMPHGVVRVWCCQTTTPNPHTPDCTFQPNDGSVLPENAARFELFLRDLRHILNAHGWDSRLNIADNLLAEWILGELQGLVWVTKSANLSPSPREIKFHLPGGRRFTPPSPEAMEELAKTFREKFSDARITEMPPEPAPFTACRCGEVTLAYGANVKLVGNVRHRRNDPCYGISSLDGKAQDDG